VTYYIVQFYDMVLGEEEEPYRVLLFKTREEAQTASDKEYQEGLRDNVRECVIVGELTPDQIKKQIELGLERKEQ
jgi:hypothetical protein